MTIQVNGRVFGPYLEFKGVRFNHLVPLARQENYITVSAGNGPALDVLTSRTVLSIKEPLPYGSDGRMAETQIAEIEEVLASGRPVYMLRPYGLGGLFDLQPAGNGLLQVFERE